MVFLLKKMGNLDYALMLIIEKLGDVLQAVAFVEEQKDEAVGSYTNNKCNAHVPFTFSDNQTCSHSITTLITNSYGRNLSLDHWDVLNFYRTCWNM